MCEKKGELFFLGSLARFKGIFLYYFSTLNGDDIGVTKAQIGNEDNMHFVVKIGVCIYSSLCVMSAPWTIERIIFKNKTIVVVVG